MTSPSDLPRIAGAYMEAEIASQPDCWERAAELSGSFESLRRAGERVAIVGCGTSWFVAQAVASLREAAELGISDSFAASEAPLDSREYDAVIAISRSGTTTEIASLLTSVPAETRKVVIVADAATPVATLADEVIAMPFADERSVVQTRFASSVVALARAAFGEDLTAAANAARGALEEPVPTRLVDAEQVTFLGTGWTVGLAHEAALKMRESSQSWTESYPAMEYRHGPMSIATEGRVVWMLGDAPEGLDAEVSRTGAVFVGGQDDALVDLVRAHRVALARSRARGLDADAPRNLTRSVILTS